MNRPLFIPFALLLSLATVITAHGQTERPAWYEQPLATKPSKAKIEAALAEREKRIAEVSSREDLNGWKTFIQPHLKGDGSYCRTYSADSLAYLASGERFLLSRLALCEFDSYMAGGNAQPFVQYAEYILRGNAALRDGDLMVVKHTASLFEAHGYFNEALQLWRFLEQHYVKLGRGYEFGLKEPRIRRVLAGFFVGYGSGLFDNEFSSGKAHTPTRKEVSELLARMRRSDYAKLHGNIQDALDRMDRLASSNPLLHTTTNPTGEPYSPYQSAFESFDVEETDRLRFIHFVALTYWPDERLHSDAISRQAKALVLRRCLKELVQIYTHRRWKLVSWSITPQEQAAINEDLLLWWPEGFADERWQQLHEMYRLNDINVYAENNARAEVMSQVRRSPGDASACHKLARILESSNDHAAAAHYYRLAHDGSRTKLTSDSLRYLKAHMLACEFFGKLKASRHVVAAYDPKCTELAYPGIMAVASDSQWMVMHVIPSSGAERAGLWPGDVIEKVKGRSLNVSDTLRRILLAPSGSQIEMVVSRTGVGSPLTLSVPVIPYDGPCGTRMGHRDNAYGPSSYEADVVDQQEALQAEKIAALDSAFKTMAGWQAVAKNAALAQRVSRCLEALNQLADQPIDAKAFKDADMALGLVGVLAQIVADAKQGNNLGESLNQVAPILTELATNEVARRAAEKMVSRDMPVASVSAVNLEGGGRITEQATESDFTGDYQIVEYGPTCLHRVIEPYNVENEEPAGSGRRVLHSFIAIRITQNQLVWDSQTVNSFQAITHPNLSSSAYTMKYVTHGQGQLNGHVATVTLTTIINHSGQTLTYSEEVKRPTIYGPGQKDITTGPKETTETRTCKLSLTAPGVIRVSFADAKGGHCDYIMRRVQ